MGRFLSWRVPARMGLSALLAFSTPHAQGMLFLLLLWPVTSAADEGSTVSAATVTVYDTYLRQDSATTNFGNEITMHVQSRSGSRNRRAVVEFDLTSIPTTAAVKTSRMNLFMTSAPSQSRTYNMHRITGVPDWTGNTATWNVRIVSCVPGSPMDCAAMTPTASPILTGVPRARSRP